MARRKTERARSSDTTRARFGGQTIMVAWQQTGDEGLYLPNVKLLCLWNAKKWRQYMNDNNQICLPFGQIQAFMSHY